MAGKLVFAGTPIGNIRDASLRLFDVIYESDIIIAEVATTCHDVLLKMGIDVWYKIQQYPNTMNFNGGSYNIDFDTKIVEEAVSGKNVLFLSDFGMPCISDPGQSIISLARSTHPEIKIDVIPGPSAVVSAFVHAASNDDNEFHFY
jgi:16S rRNA (cytidine1402-2'-O)-methyltransferase